MILDTRMTPVATTLCSDDGSSTASFSVKDSKIESDPASRTKVGFVESHITVSFEKVEEETKHEIWYTAEEYDIIKARNSLIVKMMKTGNFEESQEHSFRGLEHKLKAGYKQRRANKFNALNAVLEEQDRQYARGIVDADKIGSIYRQVAQNARESAFFMGLKDSEQSYGYKMPEIPKFEIPQSETGYDSDDGMSSILGEQESFAQSSIKKAKKSKFRSLLGKLGNKAPHQPANVGKEKDALSVHRKMNRRASM